MKKFAILTDSCCDLDRENRARFDVDYLSMRMLFNERDLPASEKRGKRGKKQKNP